MLRRRLKRYVFRRIKEIMAYYTPLIVIVLMALAILCVLVRENDRFSKEKKAIMYISYAAVGVVALSEWLGVTLSGNPEIPSLLLRSIKFFDYILTPLAGGAIALQIQSKGVRRIILFCVLAANTLFQTISVFTGWMIRFDDQNNYSHQSGYYVYIGFYLTIIVLVILEFALYGRHFRRQNRISLYAIMVFSVVGILMQEIMGGLVRTAYISLTLSLTLLFIHNSEFAQLESDDRLQEQMIRISVDPLTGISNRYAYTAAMNDLSSKILPDDLTVFSIDINGLKAANDTYGHNAGDELIKGASDCISSVLAPYGECYRTGGDEFIVIADLKEDMISALKEQIEEKAGLWQGKEVPSMALSVGWARAADHPDTRIDKLVSAADMEMYKAKSAYYREKGIDRRKS